MPTLLALLPLLAVVLARPQAGTQNAEPSSPVEVEKQEIVELAPRQLFDAHPQKHVEDHTKAILAKIAEVNQRQGLAKPKTKPLFPFPLTTYLRSEGDHHQRQATDFKFPTNPFTNPVFEYLERKKPVQQLDVKHVTSPPTLVQNATTNAAAIQPSDIIPGQYIKRKITHQQTVLVPLQAFAPPSPEYYSGYQPYPTMVADAKANLEKQTVDNIKSIVGSPVEYYPPYYYQQGRPGKQFGAGMGWPFGQYFPIHIRDPVMQMVNAVTSMVEYGPGAGTGGFGCKTKPPKSRNTLDEEQENEEVEEPASTVLEIEDLTIGDNATTFRASKRIVAPNQLNATGPKSALYKYPVDVITHSPPKRDQQLEEDEELDEEKAEDISLNNDKNNKMFTTDNTGSGIFIHKLKVRKGGVAIAGPGGIATAGSGGTAIVGPNGFAYTHPDSLAIAGSGTKVIAVEPSINLADIVHESKVNRTRGQAHHPRVGKVVAVGPVVYYNKG